MDHTTNEANSEITYSKLSVPYKFVPNKATKIFAIFTRKAQFIWEIQQLLVDFHVNLVAT